MSVSSGRDDFRGERLVSGEEVVREFCRGEVFSEVGDGDFFVGGDAVACDLFCGLVEVVASEEFFCVGCAEVDEFLMEVGMVGAEFCDVYGVGGAGRPVYAVFAAFGVFTADDLNVCVILFEEAEMELFKDAGQVAAVEGGFKGIGGPRVNLREGRGEEGFRVKGCVGHGLRGSRVMPSGMPASVLVYSLFAVLLAGYAVRHARDCADISVVRWSSAWAGCG